MAGYIMVVIDAQGGGIHKKCPAGSLVPIQAKQVFEKKQDTQKRLVACL
jgi:hypothetical protein